jgi:hypothetical protein
LCAAEGHPRENLNDRGNSVEEVFGSISSDSEQETASQIEKRNRSSNCRKSKRKIKNASQTNASKKFNLATERTESQGRPQINLILYLKMQDTNIVAEVKRHVKYYQSLFNEIFQNVGPRNPKNWNFTGEIEVSQLGSL